MILPSPKTILKRCLGAALGIFLLAGWCGHAIGADGKGPAQFKGQIQPILSKYCYDCHGDGEHKGNLALDQFKSDAELMGNQELWWNVLKNIRAGLMPPAKKPRPAAEDIHRLETWIKAGPFGVDAKNPDPGRVTIRRLNRVEYKNTIRDLMGVEFESEVEFPPDDSGHGFDNIGDVLTVSPLLLEKYIQAASTIVGRSVPTVSKVMATNSVWSRAVRGEDRSKRSERFSFYSEAATDRTFAAKHDGKYRVVVETTVRGAFDFDPGRCKVAFKIDGTERYNQELAWGESKAIEHQYEVDWKAGDHKLAFELHPLTPESLKVNQLDFQIVSVEVQGPLEKEHWLTPPNYDRFFPKGPPGDSPKARRDQARQQLTEFATRAFRRPVDGTYVDKLVKMAKGVFDQPGKTYEEGIARGMIAVLASPRFLFRQESLEPRAKGETFARIDEYSLASRLSYFLWSTMPDEELLRLAGKGQLRKNLPAQIQRMLKDERSETLVRNFTGQWLQARDVESISIDARAVLGITERRLPGGRRVEFSPELREDMRRETEMSFEYVMREDRSVLELIDCDYAFLNSRLAKHYGVADVSSTELHKVSLPKDSPRGGLLTQGTVLVVTSNPTRTSPVKRGQFILDNILGTPAPPPPANVPDLEESKKDFKDREPTLREMLAVHRKAALCSSCHSMMDPLGMALENFNALGMWRDKEGDQAIDATGKLITGEEFHDIRDIKKIVIQNHRGDFYRCLTEKLLTFALGRGLEYYDVQTVDQIIERMEAKDGKFSALLLGVIESAPFQKQRDVVSAKK